MMDPSNSIKQLSGSRLEDILVHHDIFDGVLVPLELEIITPVANMFISLSPDGEGLIVSASAKIANTCGHSSLMDKSSFYDDETKGRIILGIWIYQSENVLIGLEMGLVNGTNFFIFNNGDEFFYAWNSQPPPASESGVVRLQL